MTIPNTASIDLSTATGQTWEFRPEGGNWQPIAVPGGGWRAQGLACDAGRYRTRLTLPASAAGRHVRLVFEAINFGSHVRIAPADRAGDDAAFVTVAQHVGGWMPVATGPEMAAIVEPGASYELIVDVMGRNRFLRDGKYLVPQGATWQDALADGLLRGVRMEILPIVFADCVRVRTDVENDIVEPLLTLTNGSRETVTATIDASLAAAGGRGFSYPALKATSVTLLPGETRDVSLGRTLWGLGPDSYWWPNVPYQAGYRAVRHELALRIATDRGSEHTVVHPFGFRQFQAKGSHYYLNGVRCNLRGDNQQEANFGTDAYGVDAGFGPPTAGNPGWPHAVDNLLRLNFNVLRIHQIPATPYMLDVCDDLGLMIVDETPIRGSEGREDFVGGRENMIGAARDLALRDRHHPSIVLWSAANEIWEQRGLTLALQAAILAVDDTRPVIVDGVGDLGPEIINMEHYVGDGVDWTTGLGSLPEHGGTRRTDRPYGETEAVWPADNHPQGFTWMSTATRIRRLKENADIRNYVLNNAWPNYVAGHGPERQYLERKIKDIQWEHVRRFGMEMMPAIDDPWNHPQIRLMQQSFHPFLACDVEFDDRNKLSDDTGAWPVVLPDIEAGKPSTRRIAVFNDSFDGGEVLTLRWSLQADGAPVPGQAGRTVVRVPYGEFRERSIAITPPVDAGTVTLALTVERAGAVVFAEDRCRFRVTQP